MPAQRPNQNSVLFLGLVMACIVLFLLSLSSTVVLSILSVTVLLILTSWKPEIGLYLMTLCLPIIDYNFFVGPLIIPLVDGLAVISLAGFVLHSIFRPREAKGWRWPALVPYLIFLAAVLTSSFFTEYIAASVWYGIRWIALFYFAYIILPVNIIKDEARLRKVLWCMLFSQLAVALIGLSSLFLQDWQNLSTRIRPVSFFGGWPLGDNHNLIAEFLVVGVFFTIAMRYWTRSSQALKYLTLSSGFLMMVALGTFSRAAWIALFLQWALYLAYRASIKKSLVPFLIVLFLLSPLAIYMVRLQSQFEVGVSSTQSRLLLTEISVQALLEKPFFGHGSGNFYGIVGDNIRFLAKYGSALDSHGVIQKIIAENGLVGMATFSVFVISLFYILWIAIRSARGTPFMNIILPLSVGAFGGFFFQFFNTSYYKGKAWLPIGIAIAAAYLMHDKKIQTYAKK